MKTYLVKGDVSLPLEAEIHARLRDGRAESFTLIVPTPHARQKWLRECLAAAPGGVVADLRVFTLEEFVQQVYRASQSPRRPLSTGLQHLCFQQILDDQAFGYLKPHPEIPVPAGTVARLVNAVGQLKTNGIRATHLQQDLAELRGTNAHDKLADLIRVYESYERRIKGRWTDRAGIHQAASDWFSQPGGKVHERFPGLQLIVALGFDVFSPPDLSILLGVAATPGVQVVVELDYCAPPDGDPALFGHMADSVAQLLTAGFEERHVPDNDFDGNPYFARNLFNRGESSQLTLPLECSEQITLVQAPNRTQEVERIAGLIKQLVLQPPHHRLRDICVAFYDLDRYAPLVREVFPLYGIPYQRHGEEALTKAPVVISIFALLEVIADGRSHQRRRWLAGNSYFRWEKPVNETIAESGLDKQLPPAEFKQQLNALLHRLQVYRQILAGSHKDSGHGPDVAGEIAAYQRFLSLVDELAHFLTVEGDEQRDHALHTYVNWLRQMALQTTYTVDTFDNGGVYVLPLVQMKALRFNVVILGGMVDGEFPMSFRADVFLPPKRSRTESDRLREDRYLFYQALTCFKEHLYLTWPERDGDIELARSTFLDELQRIAMVDTQAAAPTPIFSTEQFLKACGQSVWAHSASEEGRSSFPTEFTENTEVFDSVGPFNPKSDGRARLSTPSDSPLQRGRTLRNPKSKGLPLALHATLVEKSRLETHIWPEYEGHLPAELLSEQGRLLLSQRRDDTHAVTALEIYGQCPFRYFSRHLLELAEDSEDDEDGLPDRERGRLLHDMLFEFYDKRREKPDMSAYSDEAFEAAVADVEEIARRHLARTQRSGLFWEIDVEKLLGGHGRKGVLRTFLEGERERKRNVRPAFFEVAFGSDAPDRQRDPELSTSLPVTLNGVNLKGRIDRVEVGEGVFVIGDYKGGSSTAKFQDILEGRSLQLPLYVAVGEQLLRSKYGRVFKGVGAVYYTLHDDCKVVLGVGDATYNGIAFGKFRQSAQLLPTEGIETVQQVSALVTDWATQYAQGIGEGQFPLTTHDTAVVCQYCPYKTVCRIGTIDEETA